MPIVRDIGVVLRRLDYSETSQIIVLFTRGHGKVRAIGKGVKRSTKTRFAAGIDLLDVGQLVVSSRQERTPSLATLTEWRQTLSLSGLRETLPRLYAAQYITEVTGHLTEDWDPHTELFDAMLAILAELTDVREPLPSVIRFQRSLLDAVGLAPRFDACVLCGRGADLTHFSSTQGGMVCRHCVSVQAEKHSVTPATHSALQNRTISDRPAGPFSLLNYHITHLMGRQPLLAPRLLPADRSSGR